MHTGAGDDVWEFEGTQIHNIGLNAVAGRPSEDYGIDPTSFALRWRTTTSPLAVMIRGAPHEARDDSRPADAHRLIGASPLAGSSVKPELRAEVATKQDCRERLSSPLQ